MADESREQFLPLCSVVICTRDRPERLEHCLAAVSRLNYPRFFTVVVDNAPRDQRTRKIAARWGARYVLEPIPGLSRARNRGAAGFDSEIVAYLDDDSLPASDWLSSIVVGFQDPAVMVVTGRVIAPATEAVDETYLRLMRRCYHGGPSPLVVDSNTPGWFELVGFGWVGIGANMAFRRRAFEVWGGFDTRLGRGAPLKGAEEHYAFTLLVARGFKLVYAPGAVVQHPCLASKQDLWRRHLEDLGVRMAYPTFLFFEEPRYRRVLLSLKLRSLGRKLRNAGDEIGWRQYGIAGMARAMLAHLSGPWLYFRSRWARSS